MGVFSEGNPILKPVNVVSTIQMDVNSAASTFQSSTTVAHNLGYRPAFLAYFRAVQRDQPDGLGDIYYPTPYLYFENGGGGSTPGICSLKVDVVSDSTNISCYIIKPNVTSSSGIYSKNYIFRFYIYLLDKNILRIQ